MGCVQYVSAVQKRGFGEPVAREDTATPLSLLEIISYVIWTCLQATCLSRFSLTGIKCGIWQLYKCNNI